MAGKIHRYAVEEESALLPGIGPFPEPDYWSNEEPIMAICQPYIRSSRDEGDWIFHVPKKGEVERGPEYQITGMLKVQDSIDAREVIKSGRFDEEWVRRFKVDLADCGHLVDQLISGETSDVEMARKRVLNHLVGDPDECRWFGASGVNIRDVAQDIDIELSSFDGPQAAELSDREADALASELEHRLDEAPGTPPNAVY